MSHACKPAWLPKAALFSVLAFGMLVGGTWLIAGHLPGSRVHNATASSQPDTQLAPAPVASTAPASAQSLTTSRPTEVLPKAVSSAPDATVVVVPEAKLQLTLPDSIKDLAYVSNTVTLMNGVTVTQIFLSTTSVEASDPACSASNGALGAFTMADGQYSATDPLAGNFYGALVKQFPTYFVAYSHPQGACSMRDQALNAKVAVAQRTLVQAAKKGEQAQ